APMPEDDDLPRFVRRAAEPQATEAPAPASAKHPRPDAEPRGMGTSLMRAVAQRRGASAYRHPAPGLLKKGPAAKGANAVDQTVLRGTARLLEDVLADFGVKGEVRDVKPGPVI